MYCGACGGNVSVITVVGGITGDAMDGGHAATGHSWGRGGREGREGGRGKHGVDEIPRVDGMPWSFVQTNGKGRPRDRSGHARDCRATSAALVAWLVLQDMSAQCFPHTATLWRAWQSSTRLDSNMWQCGRVERHRSTSTPCAWRNWCWSPFPAQIQAHFIPSGTRLAESYQDSCFLHDTNMFAKQGNGPKPTHSDTLGKLEPCVHRGSRLDERSPSLLLREKKRRERERMGKKKEERKRLDWGASAVSSRALIWRFWYEGRTWPTRGPPQTTLNLIFTDNQNGNQLITTGKARKKNGRKKREEKRKRGPNGVPPEMGPRIDFLHKNCQEKL